MGHVRSAILSITVSIDSDSNHKRGETTSNGNNRKSQY